MKSKSKHSVVLLVALALLPRVSAQIQDSNAAMTNIRRRISSASRRAYSQPLVFVGVIEAFGPVFMGVCKQAVNENVDFKIETVVLGAFRGSELRTGFINCTGAFAGFPVHIAWPRHSLLRAESFSKMFDPRWILGPATCANQVVGNQSLIQPQRLRHPT